jgi:site-specific recombinase XerD
MTAAVTTRTPANKGKKLPAEPLTQEEVKALIRACSMRAQTGIRNRALIVVMYRAGLRVSEALALMPKDLNTDDGSLRVLHGKGDRSRLVGLDTGAMAVLQVWLERRAALGLNGKQRIFCTLKGRPLKTGYVRTLLPRLARKVGIEKRVHPHSLRHTFSFELAGEGIPMHQIQAQLGHSCLSTTSRYLAHLNPAAVVAAMRGREWAL